METIYTEAELADLLKLPAATLGELRRRENWTHLRFGRSVRYTSEQVEEIVKRHTTVNDPQRSEVEELMRRTGLTRRGAQNTINRRRAGR